MIKNIATEIVIFDSSITFDRAQSLANKILKRVEKEGMLPPAIRVNNKLFKDSWYELNKWETKDEKKRSYLKNIKKITKANRPP